MAPIINADTINAIKDAVSPLASKIGQGAEHLYIVFVKQQVVNGATQLIYALFCIAGLVALLYLARYLVKVLTEGDGRHSLDPDLVKVVKIAVLLVSLLIGGITLSVTVGYLTNGLAHVINPEYYSVQDILNTIKR